MIFTLSLHQYKSTSFKKQFNAVSSSYCGGWCSEIEKKVMKCVWWREILEMLKVFTGMFVYQDCWFIDRFRLFYFLFVAVEVNWFYLLVNKFDGWVERLLSLISKVMQFFREFCMNKNQIYLMLFASDKKKLLIPQKNDDKKTQLHATHSEINNNLYQSQILQFSASIIFIFNKHMSKNLSFVLC